MKPSTLPESTEFELRLQIPPPRMAALLAALRIRPGDALRLRALYFDTPDGQLARHGISLRLRREGRTWFQTAKGTSTHLLERLEHNVRVGVAAARSVPTLDLARHAGTPVGTRIAEALGGSQLQGQGGLQTVFETQVQRQLLQIKTGAAVIELALDRGRIRANDQSLPVAELEVELKRGHPGDAVSLARRWCSEHGLWLNTSGKADRGRRLAGMPEATPSPVPERLPPPRDAQALGRAVLRACLEPMLPGASQIAAGQVDAHAVHQVRVGIRRLRTALRELPSATSGTDPAWEAVLVSAFRELGRHRDRSHLATDVAPLLEAQGGPALAPPADDGVRSDPSAVVRSAAFQDVLLGLLELAHGQPAEPVKRDRKGLRADARQRLQRLHSRSRKQGRRFADLDEAAQHQVRKRLKRLRYLAEFVAPLFPRRRTRRFIEGLKPVQDALGNFNDNRVAYRSYREQADTDPRAWFAVGWLAALHTADTQACVDALKAFARVEPFWD